MSELPEPEPILTEAAPGPTRGAPYVQAMAFGALVFTSGQLPVDVETGDVVPGGIGEQTAQALQNLHQVLTAAHSGLDRILKTTVYLRSRDDWPAMNAVYRDLVGQPPPARSAVVVGEMSFDALVEIEAVAYRDLSR